MKIELSIEERNLLLDALEDLKNNFNNKGVRKVYMNRIIRLYKKIEKSLC